MAVHATTEQYEAYTGQAAPDNIDALLRAASRTVDQLAVGRVYDTTDAEAVQALTDATCAVARELAASAALEAGGSLEWGNVSIGTVSLSGRQAAAGTVLVAGVPVPVDARHAVQSLGPVRVIVC